MRILLVFALSATSFLLSLSQPRLSAINIGEQCPDLSLKMTGLSTSQLTTIKISSFRGKLLILDFWATWCSPCRTFFKRIDSLEKQYGDKLVILPVTEEDSATVVSFLDNYAKATGIHINSIIHERNLKKLFPHQYIPHEVWIAPDGKVLSITDYSQVNGNNIDKVLHGEQANMPIKVDPVMQQFDTRKPVLLGNQGIEIPDSLVLFRNALPGCKVIITRPMPSLIPCVLIGPGFISCLNQSIANLYQIIAGQGQPQFINPNGIRLEVKDTSLLTYPGDRYEALEWGKTNNYCFEIALDTAFEKDKFKTSLDLLNEYCIRLNITGSLEDRTSECYALTSISNNDLLKTKGGSPKDNINAYGVQLQNADLSLFFFRLQTYYLQRSPIRIIDESGIHGKVDLRMTCNMSDIESLNEGLKNYGLQFKRVKRKLPFVIIRNVH